MNDKFENNQSKQNAPLVSIVTPILNGIKYLEQCIQSVLSQTYPNIEHIFIDGGSTDGTLDMLSGYQARYPDRIRFISEKDEGVGEAVNKGLKMARGDIFSWLDSDDLYEQDAVLAVVNFFQSNQDAYFVFGGCDIIDETGEIIDKRPEKDFNFKEAVNDRHYIFLPAVFYRREAIDKAGLFNKLGNDLDFYLRIAASFKLHRTDKTLAKWRRHQSSITSSKQTKDREIDRQRFREDYLICRRYGGNVLASRCRRYYLFLILDRLGIYLFVNSLVLPRLRRHSISRRIMKLLGA